MWGIWDCDSNHWVRELPSKVDDGGIAVLAFWSKREACRRAAKHFGFDDYADAKRNGCCEVRRLDAQ
jgi:hypothetical protein